MKKIFIFMFLLTSFSFSCEFAQTNQFFEKKGIEAIKELKLDSKIACEENEKVMYIAEDKSLYTLFELTSTIKDEDNFVKEMDQNNSMVQQIYNALSKKVNDAKSEELKGSFGVTTLTFEFYDKVDDDILYGIGIDVGNKKLTHFINENYKNVFEEYGVLDKLKENNLKYELY